MDYVTVWVDTQSYAYAYDVAEQFEICQSYFLCLRNFEWIEKLKLSTYKYLQQYIGIIAMIKFISISKNNCVYILISREK
jgi:hypothetical protein